MKPITSFYLQYILVAFLLLVFNSSYAQKIHWIPFNWEGAMIEGNYFDKLAMSVPVTIDNLPYKFKMQLDLGAESTMIYGNTISNYLLINKKLDKQIDTLLEYYMNSKKYPKFKDVDFKVGNVSFGKINIGYFKGFGDEVPRDSINTSSVKWLGTVAPDIFQGKILIIDYPNQRICVVDKIPINYAKASFQPFKLKNGRIKIPLSIDGAQNDLLFDTGSSLFPLLTTESRANQISGTTIIDSIKTSSWGDHYYVYGRKTIIPIKFGTTLLKPATVFFDRKHKFDQFYKQEDMWGITGNAYFLNNVVIIDFKNKLFGVI